jgi:phage N-6-adenine-methyltransferase
MNAGGTATIKKAIQEALDKGRAPTNADIQRAVKGSHYRTQFTGENEWYTPAEYVEAARACLGAIDLDPASSAVAQKTVRAARFFSRDNDGLRQEWHGRIWLNPPYAQPDIARFVDKLLVEVDVGRATEAILLTHNYTDTGWFHAAAGQCAAICFTRGRIRFVGASGEIAAPTQGQPSISARVSAGSMPLSAASGLSDDPGQRIQPATLGLRDARLLQPEATAEDRGVRRLLPRPHQLRRRRRHRRDQRQCAAARMEE